MLWILSLGALSNTHAIEHTHLQAALSDELLQHLCGLNSIPAMCFVADMLETQLSLVTAYFLMGCCCAFTIFLKAAVLIRLIRPGIAHLSQSVPVHALLEGMCLLPEVQLQFFCD